MHQPPPPAGQVPRVTTRTGAGHPSRRCHESPPVPPKPCPGHPRSRRVRPVHPLHAADPTGPAGPAGSHQESLHHVSTTSARMNPTKVSGTRNRDHLNISVLDTRRDLLATLESWSQTVVEELGGTPPQHTAAGLAQFLIENLKSLCCRPEAADFADEIANTATELRRIIDPGTGTRARTRSPGTASSTTAPEPSRCRPVGPTTPVAAPSRAHRGTAGKYTNGSPCGS